MQEVNNGQIALLQAPIGCLSTYVSFENFINSFMYYSKTSVTLHNY